MHFINNINFVMAVSRREFDVLPQGADLINAAVGCPVDLNDVKTVGRGDLAAGNTFTARGQGRSFLAIEGLGQDAGARGLAYAPGPAKQKRVGNAFGLNGSF